MTVTAGTTNRVSEVGNGSKTAFDFSFRIFDPAELQVFKVVTATSVQTLQTITTDYTVAINGIDNALTTPGGTVTYSVAPAATETSLILSNYTLDQQTDIPTASNIPEEAIEDALDKLTLISIQQQEEIDRSAKLPEAVSNDLSLPVPTANKALLWNGTADAVINSTDDFNDIVTDATTQATNAANSASSASASAAAAAASAASAQGALSDYLDFGHVPTRTGNKTFTVPGDVTSNYPAGRRLRLTDSSTLFGVVVTSSFSSVTTITIEAGGNLTASLSKVELGIDLNTKFISVKDFGAVGDGTTDDTVALQAALDYVCNNSNTTGFIGPSLYVQRGNYRITANLVAPAAGANVQPLVMFGEGTSGNIQSRIFANNVAVTRILDIDDNGSSRGGNYIRNLTFDGVAGTADYGIYSERLTDSVFDRVRITGCSSAGFYWENGWVVRMVNCDIRSNTGNGVECNGQGNGFYCAGTHIANNSLVGILLRTGTNTTITGSTLEGNAGAAIYIRNVEGLSVLSNYFEDNGTTGFTFTSPLTRTVKSDIIINAGSVDTTMDPGLINRGVEISGNTTTASTSGVESFVYFFSASNVRLTYNSSNPTGTEFNNFSLFKTSANPALASLSNMNITGNRFGTDPVVVDSADFDNSFQADTVFDEGVPQINYAVQDVLRYSVTTASSGGQIQMSDQEYNGFPAMQITNLASGSTHLFGFTLDMADYPELAGQIAYFGAYVRTNVTTAVANVIINGIEVTQSAEGDTDWKWRAGRTTLPSSGTIKFEFRLGSSASATDSMFIARPTLSVMGAHRDFHNKLRVAEIRHEANAAPTIGTWAQGDVVYDDTPSASGHIGFVCVTGGTPGTWKTFGSISA